MFGKKLEKEFKKKLRKEFEKKLEDTIEKKIGKNWKYLEKFFFFNLRKIRKMNSKQEFGKK